jgi:excisionase family DNA binding protein
MVMTTKEVAERCGVSTRAVRYWVQSGKLRPVRISRGRGLFDAEEVERFRQEREGFVGIEFTPNRSTPA